MCRGAAEANDIALATLATRKDIDNLLIDRQSSRLAGGWRYHMIGERLLEFLHGQRRIVVVDGKLVLDDNAEPGD